MPQIDIYSIIAVFFAIGLVYLLGTLLVMPIKIIVKLILNGIIGTVLLFVINIFSPFLGFSIAINPITALVAGFLGIPGVVLLIFLQFLL